MNVAWLEADWPALPGVVAGTTLRQGGCSSGPYESLNLATHVGDEPQRVTRNHALFREACCLPSEPRWLVQVHGTTVLNAASASPESTGDAMQTELPDVVCAVLTADCLPVVFASRSGRAVAVAHAGWRGLAGGILESTVASMACEPQDLQAWLGPAISQPAFEVGAEVREQFVSHDSDAAIHFLPNSRGRWQADLYGLARRRLQDYGVTEVYGGDRCTYGETSAFFSYRRDGVCGRMATFVFRRPDAA
ncbi:MAG TPA: peptidoglycan editing factor PgeF [Woeseiaceae bacterium]